MLLKKILISLEFIKTYLTTKVNYVVSPSKKVLKNVSLQKVNYLRAFCFLQKCVKIFLFRDQLAVLNNILVFTEKHYIYINSYITY